MKSRKGFVQIPLLIAIIAGVLVVGGGGYFGIKQYQNYRAEKIESEKQAQTLAETQNKSLEEAQQEIEKLKEESAEAKRNKKLWSKKFQVDNKSQLHKIFLLLFQQQN